MAVASVRANADFGAQLGIQQMTVMVGAVNLAVTVAAAILIANAVVRHSVQRRLAVALATKVVGRLLQQTVV